ncbi:MAG: hypothetical protein JWR22_747 [Herminiimonas sp.]|nr:hypothetical protein [Herminiimonas sp.]
MSGERLLCGVLPDSIMRTGNILESSYDVTFVTTLEQARHALASAKFDLIICGVHFDDGQMPLLLQHCKADLRLKEVPFMASACAGEGFLKQHTFTSVK